MRKVFKCFPWIISSYLLISHVIGLAGMPEDLNTWKGWINITYSLSKSMSINQNIIQWVFLGVGLFVLYIFSGVHKKVFNKLYWGSSKKADKNDYERAVSTKSIDVSNSNAIFIDFNPKANPPSILNAHNISGAITKDGYLAFTFTFDEPLENENYMIRTAGTINFEYELFNRTCSSFSIQFGEPCPDLVRLEFILQGDIIDSKEKTVEILDEQQKPKLQISFDPETCFKDTVNYYPITQNGKVVCNTFSYKWSIFIRNMFAETVKNVEVQLIDINKRMYGEARNLPEVHLKLANNANHELRVMNINPESHRFVEVIECIKTSHEPGIFYVLHVEKDQKNQSMQLFCNNIDDKDCYIRIEADGEDASCDSMDFTIGLRDGVIKMWPT